MKHVTHPGQSGFSLVELLVVITIVAILIALVAPSLRNAREVAMQARCGAQLRSSNNAMMAYAADYREWGPTSVTWNCPSAYYDDGDNPWVDDYFGSGPNLRCPTDFPVGNTKAVGGQRWRGALISSYHMLFGLGASLNNPSTAGDHTDVWWGWRMSRPDYFTSADPTYAPVPRLSLMGRRSSYTNKARNLTYTAQLMVPSEQPLAVDGYHSGSTSTTTNYRTFYGAGPGSGSDSTPARVNRPVMHQFLEGVNVLYGDGHVAWRNDTQITYKLKLVSGNSVAVFW